MKNFRDLRKNPYLRFGILYSSGEIQTNNQNLINKEVVIMKLRNITNVAKFLETVDQCKGDVYLTTPQGDRLNLKSQLTKMLAMTSVFDSAEIKEMDLEFTEPADVATMLHFSMEAAC